MKTIKRDIFFLQCYLTSLFYIFLFLNTFIGCRILHVKATGRSANSDRLHESKQQRFYEQQSKIESSAESQRHQEINVVQKPIADRSVAGEQDAEAEQSSDGILIIAQIEDLEGKNGEAVQKNARPSRRRAFLAHGAIAARRSHFQDATRALSALHVLRIRTADRRNVHEHR